MGERDQSPTDDLFKIADKIVKEPRDSWWARQDSRQKFAWRMLCGAAGFGVLGVPIASLLFEDASGYLLRRSVDPAAK